MYFHQNSAFSPDKLIDFHEHSDSISFRLATISFGNSMDENKRENLN